MSATKPNMLKGVALPMLSNMTTSRVVFIRGMKQLCACCNALAVDGSVLIQNEFFSVLDDTAPGSSKSADTSIVKTEGSPRGVPAVDLERAVEELLQHVGESIGRIDGKLAVILEEEDGADDADEEEDLPYNQETDEDRPESGTATKNALRDAYDARMALKIQTEELEKLKALGDFTAGQISDIREEINTLGSQVAEAKAQAQTFTAESARKFDAGGAPAGDVSCVPVRPTLTEMMQKPEYRVTYDIIMLAIKIVLGAKYDKYTTDHNLDKGVEPVEMTPHKIFKRVWIGLSDANQGDLQSKAEVAFYRFEGKSCPTFTQELNANIKIIDELQEKAREASKDGIGPKESLKKTLFLSDLKARDSELWHASYAKMESFQEMIQEMTLDAKTRDEASGKKKPRSYLAKEPYKKAGKKQYPPKNGKVPPWVKCRHCDGPHYVSNCKEKPDGKVDFEGKCNTCEVWGHRAKDCPKKEPKKKTATKANLAATEEEAKEVPLQQQVQQQQPYYIPHGYPPFGGYPMYAGGMPAAGREPAAMMAQQSAAQNQPAQGHHMRHPLQQFGMMQHQGMGMPGYGFPGGYPMAMGAMEQQRWQPDVIATPVGETAEPAAQAEPLHGQEQRRYYDARAKEWLIRG